MSDDLVNQLVVWANGTVRFTGRQPVPAYLVLRNAAGDEEYFKLIGFANNLPDGQEHPDDVAVYAQRHADDYRTKPAKEPT